MRNIFYVLAFSATLTVSAFAQVPSIDTLLAAFKRGDYAAEKAMVTADSTLAAKSMTMQQPARVIATPLQLAAIAGDADLCTLLMDNGAVLPVGGVRKLLDPITRTPQYYLPYAAYGGSCAVGKIMLARCAATPLVPLPLPSGGFGGPTTPTPVTSLSFWPYSPTSRANRFISIGSYNIPSPEWSLGSATARGNSDYCTMLLDNGESQVCTDFTFAPTALMVAAAAGRTDLARLFLAKGANVKAATGLPPTTGRPLTAADKADFTSYSGLTALHYAATVGDADCVKVLLDSGASADAADANGVTPIFYALDVQVNTRGSLTANAPAMLLLPLTNSYDGAALFLPPLPATPPADTPDYAGVIDLLIAKGASLKGPGYGGTPALVIIARAGRADLLEKAIAQGADVNAADAEGRTALFYASTADIAGTLLAHGANANATDKQGETPLFCAQSADIATALIAAGAGVNVTDKNGLTPLSCAKTADIVHLLLEKGAVAKATTTTGLTPLDNAANAEVAGELLAAGADIKATGKSGNTALHYAAQNGRTDVVKFLLMKGADPNVLNANGETPLFVAKGTETVRVLLDYHADPNLTGKGCNTPLMEYLINPNTDDAVQLLLAQPTININATTQYGDTALFSAARSGNVEAVKTLIARGVDVNATDMYHNTPLHMAVMMNSLSKDATTLANALELTTLLLKDGANPNAANGMKYTPLHLAALYNRTDICQALLAAGADPTLKDYQGKTALQLATDPATKAVFAEP